MAAMKVHKVEVLWLDASGMPGWFLNEEAKATVLATIQSIGYLISKDSKHVRIAQSINQSDNCLGDVLTIPRCQVQKIRNVR